MLTTKEFLVCFFVFFSILLLSPLAAKAMPLGALLYRTSAQGKLYGYNSKDLIIAENGFIKDVYTGHVAIYVGEENSVDYVVEALPRGVALVPAKYFINRNNGEELMGVKLPLGWSEERGKRVAEIAKVLAQMNLAYDFDFRKQKGPESGEWICSGLAEKIYESADVTNFKDLEQLIYEKDNYAIDITPDGFDGESILKEGSEDCFSEIKEFSKIGRQAKSLLPFPEILGYDAGLERKDGRYFFFPHTQFLQASLRDVDLDIEIESSFKDELERGRLPFWKIVFRWSLINNPVSSAKQIAWKIEDLFSSEEDFLIAEERTKEELAEGDKKSDSEESEKEKVFRPEIKDNPFLYSESEIDEGEEDEGDVLIKENTSENRPSLLSRALNFFSSSVNSREIGQEAELTTQALEKEKDYKTTAPQVINNYSTEVAEGKPLKLLLDRICPSGEDDYLDLYNPNHEAVDIFSGNYRLEKAKTAQDPSIMLRFNNESEADYFDSSEIAPGESYRLVRSEAKEEIKASARAVVKNKAFSFDNGPYVIYFGDDAISSETDKDIIDFVGYGGSLYAEGGSAPEIPLGYCLKRKNHQDSDNNLKDFVLEPDPFYKNEVDDSSGDSGEGEAPIEVLKPLLITAVYSQGDDDAIEIFNPNDKNFDLVANSYRLEKAKTAQDPSIMLRFTEEADVDCSNNKCLLPPKSYLLISSNKASDDFKEGTDLIVLNDNFFWGEKDYSIYLGQGAISTPDDKDIVDLIGFGVAAKYFEGSAPAPSMEEGGFLLRKASADSSIDSLKEGGSEFSSLREYDSGDNARDFLLFGFIPSIEDPVVEQADVGQEVSALNRVWHFRECQGDNIENNKGEKQKIGEDDWTVGKWDCALKQGKIYPALNLPLNKDYSLDSASFSLYIKPEKYSVLDLIFHSSFEEEKKVEFSGQKVVLNGFPGVPGKKEAFWNPDGSWHQLFLVLNAPEDYLEIYLDGNLFYHGDFQIIFSSTFSSLELKGLDAYQEIDEIAFYERSLSGEEIKKIYQNDKVLSPYVKREEQKTPQVIHHWSFDERQDVLAFDSVSSDDILVLEKMWLKDGFKNGALRQNYGEDEAINLDFKQPFIFNDLSLDFWWRSPGEHSDKFDLELSDSGGAIFGVRGGTNHNYYYYKGSLLGMGQSLVPKDLEWHHIALVYDSYNYTINYYVDGELKFSRSHTWLGSRKISHLRLISTNYPHEIDELRLWQGALKKEQIKEIYKNN